MQNLIFKDQLTTERLILKTPSLDFETARMLFNVTERNRSHLEKWLPWIALCTSPVHSFEFLQSAVKSYNNGDKVEYFIYEKETSDFCGICSAKKHLSLTENYITLGYWLDKDKCGKGYMSEAVKTIEADMFSQNVPKIVIRNDTQNFGSVNVAKRLGYHMDCIYRAEYFSTHMNSFRDMYIWSKLHPDIEKQRG